MRIVCLFLLCATFQLNATQRTLTDTQGRNIDVELIAKAKDAVIALRSDGLECEIKYDLLSQADREFLSQWEPPAPDTPENPIDAVVIMSSTGARAKGYGSGFFAHDKGKTYIYTNQHVIQDIMDIQAVDSRGNVVTLGALEISNTQDLARFRVRPTKGLTITDDVKSGEQVTALGNSEGAGVITTESGKVQGIGPIEVEISSKFVPGNSGGPVINEDSQVIGVVTYIKRGDKKPDWVKKDTRYSKARRFSIRPSRIDDWRSISREEYKKQIDALEVALNKFDQAYWTFRMLDEGTGYVSTLPRNWERDILAILRNHNSRQKRSDGTVTTYYDSYGNVTGRDVESYADKKAASKRANLRSLDNYLDDEFDFYRLKNNYIDVGYLISNEYESVNVLEGWVKSVRKDIKEEVQLSKARH